MNNIPRFSPVAAWLIALLVVFPMPWPLISQSSNSVSATADVIKSRYHEDLAEFLQAPQEDDGSARGVMLAMSGGGCATIGPHRLAPQGAKLFSVVHNNAQLTHFLGLVDTITNGNVDFVVIQDTVVTKTQQREQLREKYWVVRTFWRDRVYELIQDLGAERLVRIDKELWKCDGWPKERDDWAAEVDSGFARLTPYSEQRRVDIVSFIEEFDRLGIPVIIASAPTNSYSVAYSMKVHETASKLVHADPRLATVSLHRQPASMDDTLFPDPFHIRPEANQPYREWLNGVIMRVLQEHSD